MRCKDRHIGRLYSEFGKVPSGLGIFRSTGELRKFAEEYMGLIGLYGNRGEAARPPMLSMNWTRGRGGAPSFLLFSFPFPSLLLLLLGRAPSSTRTGGILLPMEVGLP